ncbi:MAG: hypothetical protein ACYT04_55505 [Nostoc sp.]
MGKTLKEKLEQLSPERRKKIEEESNLLIAEEMTRLNNQIPDFLKKSGI